MGAGEAMERWDGAQATVLREISELQACLREHAARGAALDQAREAAEREARATLQRAVRVRDDLQRTRAARVAAEQVRVDMQRELARLRAHHHDILTSTVWRASWPLRRLGALLPARLRRLLRPAPAKLPAPDEAWDAVADASPRPRPSELFRARDPAWVDPSERPAFTRLREGTPRGRIAVVAHIFYTDLWPEITAAIGNLTEPFDLFVTLVAGAAEDLAPTVRQAWPFAHILVVDNHGRDIVPFLEILRTGVLFRYELVCKLHTKRSLWHEDGDAWRRGLIGGVLGSTSVARTIPAAFRADPKLGLVVADGHIYAGREMWAGNDRHLLPLLRHFGMNRTTYDTSFAGGSIFWIRAGLLRGLAELELGFDEFECEPLGADGNMVHAVERMVSVICYHAGATIRQTGTIMRAAVARTETA